MKNFAILFMVGLFLSCVGNKASASPATGTFAHEVKAIDHLTVMDMPPLQVVHLEYGVAIASQTVYFEPVGYWTSYRYKIDGGRKTSYVYLMAKRFALPYGLRC